MSMLTKSKRERGSSSDLHIEEIKLPSILTECLKILSLESPQMEITQFSALVRT